MADARQQDDPAGKPERGRAFKLQLGIAGRELAGRVRRTAADAADFSAVESVLCVLVIFAADRQACIKLAELKSEALIDAQTRGFQVAPQLPSRNELGFINTGRIAVDGQVEIHPAQTGGRGAQIEGQIIARHVFLNQRIE